MKKSAQLELPFQDIARGNNERVLNLRDDFEIAPRDVRRVLTQEVRPVTKANSDTEPVTSNSKKTKLNTTPRAEKQARTIFYEHVYAPDVQAANRLRRQSTYASAGGQLLDDIAMQQLDMDLPTSEQSVESQDFTSRVADGFFLTLLRVWRSCYHFARLAWGTVLDTLARISNARIAVTDGVKHVIQHPQSAARSVRVSLIAARNFLTHKLDHIGMRVAPALKHFPEMPKVPKRRLAIIAGILVLAVLIGTLAFSISRNIREEQAQDQALQAEWEQTRLEWECAAARYRAVQANLDFDPTKEQSCVQLN